MPRITSIASVKASTACRGVRRRTPILVMWSQNPPEPRPRAKRPPDSDASEATVRASIGAGRSGRFVTPTYPPILSVRPSRYATAAYGSKDCAP